MKIQLITAVAALLSCREKRPDPILFGTTFAHDVESVLIRVIMADDRVQLFRQQVR